MREAARDGVRDAIAHGGRRRKRLGRLGGERDEVDSLGHRGGDREVLLGGGGRGEGEEDRRGEAVVRNQAARELHEGDEVPYARAAKEEHPRPPGFLRALIHGEVGDGVRLWLLV